MVAFYSPADQELYKKYQYVPQEKYRLGFTAPNTEVQKIENTFGIPATNAFTGGGGQNNYYTGTTGSLVSGFNQAVDDRQKRLEALNMPLEQKGVRGADILMEGIEFPAISGVEGYPNKIINETIKGASGVYQAGAKNTIGRRIADAFYSLPFVSKPQSAREILEEGYSGVTSGPGIMAAILGKLDRYGSLPRADQAFIASRMGYRGPTIFGENTSGLNKDPFGINTRSLFGNYAEYTKNRAEELNESIEKSKARWEDRYGDLNNTNQFGKTWAEMNKMNLEMQDFYNAGAADLKEVEEKEYQDRIDNFVKNYSRPGVKEMFEETYDGTNIHGGATTTGGTTTGGATSDDGFTGSGNFANIDNSGKDYGPYSGGGGLDSGGSNIEGSVSKGGTDDTPGTPFRRGGLASIL